MDLELSEEQKAIRLRVRELMEKEFAPLAEEIDETQTYPQALRDLLAEHELFGVPLPQEYGGLDASLLTMSIVMEEVARVCATTSMVLGAQYLGSTPLLVAGSQEQKDRYFSDIAAGRSYVSFSLTEPNAGSDAAGIETRATREGNEYVLNGIKCFCTGGDVAQVYCVFAKTTNRETDKEDVTAFVVERPTPGFSVGKIEQKMGIRASGTAELILDNVRLPLANRIGREGGGFKIAMQTLERTRPTTGAQAVGVAQGALDAAVAFTAGEMKSGRLSGARQDIQFLLADMEAEVQAARWLVYVASAKVDAGAPDKAIFSASSKLIATEMAIRVIANAAQILCGHGNLRNHPVERMMRDAKIFKIVEGTNEIQRLVIARELLGRW
ncbi:MAG: acyl-CoA dehydrogenase family protein [Chloroflexi bacterium]|nr:acyl-CoA dehydrogenase family protein [Chloroflexota bacterium]